MYTQESVHLYITCYERTFEQVLARGFFHAIEGQACFRFERRVVMINNVSDRNRVAALAKARISDGEIDEFYFVSEHIDRAMKILGLKERDLGRIPHYSDCVYVCLLLCSGEFICYWDAEVTLVDKVDWISPSLRMLKSDDDVLVVSPQSVKDLVRLRTSEIMPRRFRLGAIREIRDFKIDLGFSDQLFLARVADLRRPIYRHFHLMSLRYPLAHIAPIFEQRVDSYMRSAMKYRAIYEPVRYIHENEGGRYPTAKKIEKLKRLRNRIVVKFIYLFVHTL